MSDKPDDLIYVDGVLCKKEYDPICEDCEFRNFKMVGHPGGSSYHSTEEYYCEEGYWKDDF